MSKALLEIHGNVSLRKGTGQEIAACVSCSLFQHIIEPS
jgi:hypothetical protein